jgi:hypothetical protein
MLMTSRSQHGNTPKKPKRTVDLGVATIVAACIVAVGAIVVAFIGGRATAPGVASASPASGTSPVPTRGTHLPTLGFSLTYHQLVPWCNTVLNGTGKIPNGDSLLILDREVSSDDEVSPNSKYSLDGQARPSGNTWSLSTVFIGPRTRVSYFYDELTGILVPNGTAGFITAISLPWASHLLPPALEYINAFVLRDDDLSQCS